MSATPRVINPSYHYTVCRSLYYLFRHSIAFTMDGWVRTPKAYTLFHKRRIDAIAIRDCLPLNETAPDSDVDMSSDAGSSDRVGVLRSDDPDPA